MFLRVILEKILVLIHNFRLFRISSVLLGRSCWFGFGPYFATTGGDPEETSFVFIFYPPTNNYRWILGDMNEIIVQIEDHCVTIATMMGSRYIGGIKDKVEIWMKKIYNAADILDEWLIMQRAWMYLENIFSAEDIQKQLPGNHEDEHFVRWRHRTLPQ